MAISISRARKAKAVLVQRLAGTKGFVGAGITKVGDDYAVKVNFSTRPAKTIPTRVEGVPVTVEIVGRIKPR